MDIAALELASRHIIDTFLLGTSHGARHWEAQYLLGLGHGPISETSRNGYSNPSFDGFNRESVSASIHRVLEREPATVTHEKCEHSWQQRGWQLVPTAVPDP
jgi:hypothetical protein